MAYNDLQSKIEAAVKSLVDALALSGVTVTTGADDDAIALPIVRCVCDELSEATGLPRVGLFSGTVRVAVKSNAHDTTLAAHRARVAAVFDAISIDTLAADLSSAVADFTCIFAGAQFQGMSIADAESWENTIGFDGVFCASDV